MDSSATFASASGTDPAAGSRLLHRVEYPVLTAALLGDVPMPGAPIALAARPV